MRSGVRVWLLFLASTFCGVTHADFLYTGYRNGSITRTNEHTGAVVDVFANSIDDGFRDFSGMTLGPDGLLYVSARKYGGRFAQWGVFRFDPYEGEYLDTWINGGPFHSISFGSDGKFYGVDGWTDDLQEFDGLTGKFNRTILDMPPSSPYGVGRFLIAADETFFAVTNSYQSSELGKYDLETGNLIGETLALSDLGFDNYRWDDFDIGSDGILYASYNYRWRDAFPDGGIMQIDPVTMKVLETIVNDLPSYGAASGGSHGLAFGPENYLYAGNMMSGAVLKFDHETGELIREYPIAGAIAASAEYVVFLPVPEPTSVALGFLAVVLTCGRRRRGRVVRDAPCLLAHEAAVTC